MRAWLLLAVAPAVLSAADLRIDHVTIAGSDLQKMEERLQAIGIRPVYGGAHTNHATEMALVSFPDGSYLELMAIQTHADASAVDRHAWAKELRGNAGPTAWAVRAQDIAAETARLKTAGISVGPAERGGRERPDGIRLEWETADVGSGTRGSFFPFLIHDFTPRQERAFPTGKPSTRDFSGVARVVIAVRNLDKSAKRYQAAYGLQQPLKQVDVSFGAQLALLGGTPVVLAAPLHSQTWLAARLEQFGEGPCAFILGARKTGKYQAASKSRWFGVDISWFDSSGLGWHLGFE